MVHDARQIGDVDLSFGIRAPVGHFSASVTFENPFGLSKSRTFEGDPFRRKIVRWAERDGIRGVPSDENGPATAENHIEDIRKKTIVTLLERLRSAMEIVGNFIIRHRPNEVGADRVKRSIEAKRKALLDEAKDKLDEAHKEYAEGTRSYSDFVAKHGSRIGSRDAVYPSNYWKPFTIIFALLVFEALGNGFLFAGAAKGGIVEGFFVAFVIAAFNVLTGALTGRVLRYTFFDFKVYRWLAWAAVGVLTTAGLFLNIFVAHFRDDAERKILLSGDGVSRSSPLSLQNIDVGPIAEKVFYSTLDFDTIVAVILLLLGGIVFGISVWKGWSSFDDTYPGFGKRARSRERAKRKLDDLRNRTREAINKDLNNMRAKLASAADWHSSALKEIESVVLWLSHRASEAETAIVAVNENAASLILLYRRRNSEIRLERNGKFVFWLPLRWLGFKQKYTLNRFPRLEPPRFEASVPPIEEVLSSAEAACGTIRSNIVEIDGIRAWMDEFSTQSEGEILLLTSGPVTN